MGEFKEAAVPTTNSPSGNRGPWDSLASDGDGDVDAADVLRLPMMFLCGWR